MLHKANRFIERWWHLHGLARAAATKGEVVLLPRWGVGDYYMVAAFAPAFTAQHKLEVQIMAPANRREIVELFLPPEKIVSIPDQYARGITGLRRAASRQLYFAHFYPGELERNLAPHDTLVGAYRKILRLQPGADMIVPPPPTTAMLVWAEQFIAAQGLSQQRYCVVFPVATTTPVANATVWIEEVRRHCATRGMRILWNSPPGIPVLPTELILPVLNFQQLRALGWTASLLVATRSGICEWMSSCPCPQIVMYPPANFHGYPLLSVANLREFPAASTRHEIEINAADGIQQALASI